MNTQPAGDYPQISTSSYGDNTGYLWAATTDPFGEMNSWDQSRELKRRIEDRHRNFLHVTHQTTTETQQQNQMSTRRIVQVFIADPDPNVPIEHALIHNGGAKFTDATNEELFFEIPIKDLLAAHNDKRQGEWDDKEATKKAGKPVRLEAIKIRDLKMTVVEIAKF